MILLKLDVIRKRKGKFVKVGEVVTEAPVFINTSASYNGHMLFVEIAGVLSARKAVWAHLMKRRQATSSDAPDVTEITVDTGADWERLQLAAKTKYKTVELEDRIFVMHPAFAKGERKYFLGGTYDKPSPFFAEALRINSTIPFMPYHVEKLWQIAIETKAITSLSAYGSEMAWQVNDMDEAIIPKLKEVVSNG